MERGWLRRREEDDEEKDKSTSSRGREVRCDLQAPFWKRTTTRSLHKPSPAVPSSSAAFHAPRCLRPSTTHNTPAERNSAQYILSAICQTTAFQQPQNPAFSPPLARAQFLCSFLDSSQPSALSAFSSDLQTSLCCSPINLF